MALSPCNVITNTSGRELTEHGNVLFPMASYQDDLGVENIPWHWHDELEAAVVIKGQATVATNSKKYLIKEGDGFFVNRGTLHSAWDNRNFGCQFHSIVFHPRLVGGSLDSIFWQNYIQPLLDDTSLEFLHLDHTLPWHQDALYAVEDAWKFCVEETFGYPFAVREALSKLILLLSGHHSDQIKIPSEKTLRDGNRIKLMLQYVQVHYMEDLTIAQIAKSANISPREALRCFDKTIGTPPIQYVKHLRIQQAARLLLSTHYKIEDIASQCGFQEMSYFSKVFKAEKGCSPSQYRKGLST